MRTHCMGMAPAMKVDADATLAHPTRGDQLPHPLLLLRLAGEGIAKRPTRLANRERRSLEGVVSFGGIEVPRRQAITR